MDIVRNALDAAGVSMQPSVKRARIHMDIQDCKDYAASGEGSQALSKPDTAKSSQDPNRGLYPVNRRVNRPSEFVTAKVVHEGPLTMQSTSPYLPSTQSQGPSPKKSGGKSPGKSKAMRLVQSNSMLSYFNNQPKLTAAAAAGSSSQVACDKTTTAYKEDATSSSSVTYDLGKVCPPLPTLFDDAILVDSSEEDEKSSMNKTFCTQMSQPPPNHKRQKQLTTAPKKPNTRKKTPTFNRNNSFLYNNDPPPPQSRSVSKSSAPSDSYQTTSQASSSSSAGKALHGDRYGLLGTGQRPPRDPAAAAGGSIACMEDLPDEVLENILCRLPALDMLLNVNRVCTRWWSIISDDKFMVWKKKYLAVKLGKQGAQPWVMEEMLKNGMDNRLNYLPGLIRYIKDYKRRWPSNITFLLEQHKKHSWAVALIKERFPDCIQEEIINPWSVIATLVVIADSVTDIQELIEKLISPGSQCTAIEVLDVLYCIATFLLTFHLVIPKNVWNGMHYRLFYALYLYENTSSHTAAELSSAFQHAAGGQQSIMRYGNQNRSVQLTHEQVQICRHNVQNCDTVKIVAFAGTGKTTTLVRYTQLRPNMKFLLVVYNKSVKLHAETQFPKNVTCKTCHGLAFKPMGLKYQKAGKLNLGSLKVNDVLQGHNLRPRKGESLFVQAKLILDTLNNFMASADDQLTIEHVPTERVDKDKGRLPVTHEWRQFYAGEARSMWSKMEDFNNTALRMPHDGYLKAYQLSKPRIYGCDVILIDEAQDLTPAVADVLLRQQRAKILVGDPHQQIYAFRGAVNAMQQVEASHTFFLTQSFRFGPEIAFVAATFLEYVKSEKKKTLVGNGKPSSVHGVQEGQLAIITRCNYTLFSEAVKRCCFSEAPVKVAFVGGPDSFGFDVILDIYLLMLPYDERVKQRREIKHPLVKKFESFPAFEKFANETQDIELLGKIKIVKTYTHQLPSHINKIRSKCIKSMDMADVVFSTAHKAKGLEFSTVKLTDDYAAADVRDARGATVEESNILYVAMTRAKKRLIMPSGLKTLLNNFGESYFFPERVVFKDEASQKPCMKTHATFTPAALTLTRKDFNLSNKDLKPGGVLSPQGVRELFPCLLNLYGSETDERPAHDWHDDDDIPVPDMDDDGNLLFNIPPDMALVVHNLGGGGWLANML